VKSRAELLIDNKYRGDFTAEEQMSDAKTKVAKKL